MVSLSRFKEMYECGIIQENIKDDSILELIKTSRDQESWNRLNLKCFQQTWGNTSGGWQSIGGSAMTSKYTVVIEVIPFNISLVFYNGKFAYCYKSDSYKGKDRNLPGALGPRSKQDIEILFKHK